MTLISPINVKFVEMAHNNEMHKNSHLFALIRASLKSLQKPPPPQKKIAFGGEKKVFNQYEIGCIWPI